MSTGTVSHPLRPYLWLTSRQTSTYFKPYSDARDSAIFIRTELQKKNVDFFFTNRRRYSRWKFKKTKKIIKIHRSTIMSSSIAVTQLFQQLKHACSDIEEDAKSLKRNITSNTTSHPTHDAQGSANSILTYSTHFITNLLT